MPTKEFTWARFDSIANKIPRKKLEQVPDDTVLSFIEKLEGGEVIGVKAVRYLNGRGYHPVYAVENVEEGDNESLHVLEAYVRLHNSFIPIKITQTVSGVPKPKKKPKRPQSPVPLPNEDPIDFQDRMDAYREDLADWHEVMRGIEAERQRAAPLRQGRYGLVQQAPPPLQVPGWVDDAPQEPEDPF
jgi:hypothetical protein